MKKFFVTKLSVKWDACKFYTVYLITSSTESKDELERIIGKKFLIL